MRKALQVTQQCGRDWRKGPGCAVGLRGASAPESEGTEREAVGVRVRPRRSALTFMVCQALLGPVTSYADSTHVSGISTAHWTVTAQDRV